MSATVESMPCQGCSALRRLANIEPSIAARLEEVGIRTPEDLAEAGPIEAYRRLKRRAGETAVPLGYYLYALEGALRGVHWDHLPLSVKARLVEEAER